MRRFLLAALMFGTASGAQAADLSDLPILRGGFPAGPSTPARNWDGWYAGGQIDYTSAQTDFSRGVVGLTNFIFRDSVLQTPTSQFSVLAKNTTQGTGFGAFVGRNYQFEDLVFGLEANYNYLNRLASSSSSSIGRAIVNPPGEILPATHTHTYNVKLTGTAAVQVQDVTTFRGRAGWATGNFLPYVFGGLAVARMDASRQVTADETLVDEFDQTTTIMVGTTAVSNTTHIVLPAVRVNGFPTTQSEARTNSFVPGWTVGLGMEYMLWGNVFMRGEWEYIKFLSVKDTVVQTNSARFGIGYKF
jgi:outer membrane immunogenic protein